MKIAAAVACVLALVLMAAFLRPRPDPRLVTPDGEVADGVMIGDEFVPGPNWDRTTPKRADLPGPILVAAIGVTALNGNSTTDERSGVLVEEVIPDAPGSRYGLQPHDHIIEFRMTKVGEPDTTYGGRIESVENLELFCSSYPKREDVAELSLGLWRAGKFEVVHFPVEALRRK